MPRSASLSREDLIPKLNSAFSRNGDVDATFNFEANMAVILFFFFLDKQTKKVGILDIILGNGLI